jgi:hypothetical protein
MEWTGMLRMATGLWFSILASGLAVRPSALPYQEATQPTAGVKLTIAAPDQLNPAMTEMAGAFEQKNGRRVHLDFIFGEQANLSRSFGMGLLSMYSSRRI